MTKTLRKAITKRSSLENKYYKCNSETNRRALKKQKNYCNRFYKRERMNYYSNLNSNEITDNENFWKTMNPFFTNNCRGQDNIILVIKKKTKSYRMMQRWLKLSMISSCSESPIHR